MQERSGDFLSDLASVAADMMAVPATSVPSERLFREGFILEVSLLCMMPNMFLNDIKRKRLCIQNAEAPQSGNKMSLFK